MKLKQWSIVGSFSVKHKPPNTQKTQNQSALVSSEAPLRGWISELFGGWISEEVGDVGNAMGMPKYWKCRECRGYLEIIWNPFLFISSFSSSLIDPDRMMTGMSWDSTEIGTVGPCCRGCGEPAMSHEEFAQRKQSNEIRRIQTVIENRWK